MPVWGKTEMEVFYADGSDTSAAEVRIDGEEIVVTYADEGVVTYSGREVAPGHYRLACSERTGTASLHRFPDGDHLDGFWTENGDRGMWRLTLDDGNDG